MIQSPAGGPYGSPGQFTNFADPAVRRYNLAIALDAVNRGVDDILWDDTRRPGGDQEGMVIPGLSGSPSDSIARFLAEAQRAPPARRLPGRDHRRRGGRPGRLVGQDVARIAANSDYVAPQIFPGYWSPGGTTWPVRSTSPATSCVACSSGSSRRPPTGGAVLAPWLQDFACAV